MTTAARNLPAIVLTGPRRSGKTWLLQHLFPQASYYLFEDPDVVGRFRHDPQGFLDGVRLPVILDEIQNVPEVFNFVVPGKGGGLRLLEARASRTVTPGDTVPMQRLAAAWSKRPGARGRVERVLVHRPARAGVISRAMAPGVRALPWQEFVAQGLV